MHPYNILYSHLKKKDADFTQTWKYGHKNFQRADM